MEQYISKKEVVSMIEVWILLEIEKTSKIEDDFHNRSLETIIESIRKADAADVVPVVQGKWVKDEEYSRIHNGMSRYYCSYCGMHTASGTFKYCPGCGAKMDGGIRNG